MEKEIYLLSSTPDEKRAEFVRRLKGDLLALCSSPELKALWFTVTEPALPRFHVIPFKRDLLAAVSITTSGGGFASRFASYSGLFGGYRVHEALPVSWKRDWPLGTATPGLCLLTLFCKKKGLDQSVFFDRWYNGHTPLTLKIHPVSHYVRNEVIGTAIPREIGVNTSHLPYKTALCGIWPVLTPILFSLTGNTGRDISSEFRYYASLSTRVL